LLCILIGNAWQGFARTKFALSQIFPVETIFSSIDVYERLDRKYNKTLENPTGKS